MAKTNRADAAIKAAAKTLCHSLLQSTVNDLHAARRANNGRLPYGKMSSVLATLKQAGVEATQFTFRQLKPSTSTIPGYIRIHNDNATVVSDITPSTTGCTLTINETTINASNTTANTSGGCPKGSSTVARKTARDNKAACINKITEIFFHEKSSRHGSLPTGYLQSLIENQKREFGICDNISCDTIRSRAKRGSLAPPTRGPPSPLAAAEDALVVLAAAMARVRQPITPTEGLALMNSLIKETGLQQKLIDFKCNRCDNKNETDEKLGQVGMGYWRGFMQRHGSKLVTKRGERYSCDRSDWSKLSYIAQMYDCIYDELVTAGVAETLEMPIFYDRDGNIVEASAAYGEAANIRIIHPDYLLFADETGCNTSQKKDGNVGGQKMIPT